jgi:hypothetical protein
MCFLYAVIGFDAGGDAILHLHSHQIRSGDALITVDRYHPAITNCIFSCS